ncbi:hypothetical protein [Microbacterium sp. P05]|uniref:hypothetical protein n=1 Tax=Microbacterium sp. P05 TaxID=3366948 RepID=UPI0037465E96
MSGPAWQNKNRSVHRAVVDLVGAFFEQEEIFATVAPRPSRVAPIKISEALDVDLDTLAPDIAIPGVAVTVTSRLRHRLSDDLDAATRTAVLTGAPVGALVQWRADVGIDQSYAVMSLAHFAKLVRAAEGVSR